MACLIHRCQANCAPLVSLKKKDTGTQHKIKVRSKSGKEWDEITVDQCLASVRSLPANRCGNKSKRWTH